MTTLPPNPWFTESAQSSPPAASPATDVDFPSASVAPNLSVSDGAAAGPLPSGEVDPSVTLDFAPSESLSSHTQHVVEYFSDYAHRNSMDKVSPPRDQADIDRIGLRIVKSALNLHPRDLDEDPPPLFLRKPRPVFLRALFELGGVR